MSMSRRRPRPRARMIVVAALACLCATGVFPSAVSRHIPVPEKVAETGCVAKPLGWDPHLDWSAGPPC